MHPSRTMTGPVGSGGTWTPRLNVGGLLLAILLSPLLLIAATILGSMNAERESAG